MEIFCKNGKVESRTLNALEPVLLKKVNEPDRVIYDVCRGEDQKKELRYDLTLIYPEKTGNEMPKTFGHYHSNGQVELFEVVEGKTIAMIQKNGPAPDIIEKVYTIEASVGEKIIIPSDFGFCNINPSKTEKSIISNWININVENQYDIIKNLHGLCYYAVENDKGNIIFEKNQNYKQVPEIIKLKPKKFPKELENLEFLSNLEKYKELLIIENLYEVA